MSSFTEDEREEKLRHLMDVYGDGLKRLCCVYLRDLGLAEDAVQETFIKAYRPYRRAACRRNRKRQSVADAHCRQYL